MTVTYGDFDSAIEARVVQFLKAHPLQQFGQPDDDWVWSGATACTHTVWQLIIWMVRNTHYSLNEINALAGMPHNPVGANGVKRGMNSGELQHLIDRLKLPYRIVWGASFTGLVAAAQKGPLFYAMRYGSAPEWKGYHYGSVVAEAPYAISGGKTQLTGFENGRHAVLLAGKRLRTVDGQRQWVAYRKDPNHGSASRPERPPFDIISVTQATKEYNDFHALLGGTLYAAIPTATITVHGI